MAVTTKQENVTGSSQQVVATNAQSLLEQQNHSTVIVSSGGRTKPRASFIETVTGRRTSNELASSLMPRRVKLNEPLTKSFVEGLQQAADSAAALDSKKRLRPDVPTADLVRRGGFKTGAKLLIKIVPSASTTPMADTTQGLVLDNFSLQGVAEPDEERYQLHETFESEVLFLFGRRPRVWTLQGIVLNGKNAPDQLVEGPETEEEADERDKFNMDFANSLLRKWDSHFRGSKAIENRYQTYISYEDSVIEGTLLGLTLVRNAQIPSAANATLTFVVHSRSFLGYDPEEASAPELAQLVEEALLTFPKTPPSDLSEAKPNKDEIKRREDEAAAKAGSARTEAETLNSERNELIDHIGEKEQELAGIEEARNDANAAVAAAASPAATDADLDAANQAAQELDVLEAQKAEAEAQKQQAENRLAQVNEELTPAVTAQEDAEAVEESLAATTDAASDDGQTTEFDDPEGQSVEP
jgi:hypothetical protein